MSRIFTPIAPTFRSAELDVPLRNASNLETLSELVDFDALNADETAFVITAVDIETAC